MILLATVALTVLNGYLYTTDRFWGVQWVETMHGAEHLAKELRPRRDA